MSWDGDWKLEARKESVMAAGVVAGMGAWIEVRIETGLEAWKKTELEHEMEAKIEARVEPAMKARVEDGIGIGINGFAY